MKWQYERSQGAKDQKILRGTDNICQRLESNDIVDRRHQGVPIVPS
jgi:hypothetical protein